MVGINQMVAGAAQTGEPKTSEEMQANELMRRFFGQIQDGGFITTSTEIVSTIASDIHPKRDFDMASELLDRASAAIDLVISRYQHLERNLDEANERAQAQAVEQADLIEQWKRLASGLKSQLDIADQTARNLEQRCEAAEARAETAEVRISELERMSALAASHAARSEQLSISLHDKVVLTFGIGSRAHPLLEAVATQSAAKQK